MIKRMLPAVVGVVLAAGVAQAGTLSVAFNDNSAQAGFNLTVTEDAKARSVVGVRGLYNDRKDTELASGGLEVLGPLGKTGLELGAGVRGYYGDSDGDDLAAGGLGALVRFVPPGASLIKLSGSVYYCPKVFSGLDAERMLETEIAAAYEFVPRAAAFLSYSVVKADIEERDERTLDDSLRIGISLTF